MRAFVEADVEAYAEALTTPPPEHLQALADKVVVMTAGPATVKSSVPVPLERPRRVEEIRLTQDFVDLYRHIWDSLRTEVELTRARGARRAA